MRTTPQAVLGILLVLVGVIYLIAEIFNLDASSLCWSVLLVIAGVWILARPTMLRGSRQVETQILGDIRRNGPWQVVPEEMWLGIGSVELDLTQAIIPGGETTIQIMGLIGDVKIRPPQTASLVLESSKVLGNTRIYEQKTDQFANTFRYQTANPTPDGSTVVIKTGYLIGDTRLN